MQFYFLLIFNHCEICCLDLVPRPGQLVKSQDILGSICLSAVSFMSGTTSKSLLWCRSFAKCISAVPLRNSRTLFKNPPKMSHHLNFRAKHQKFVILTLLVRKFKYLKTFVTEIRMRHFWGFLNSVHNSAAAKEEKEVYNGKRVGKTAKKFFPYFYILLLSSDTRCLKITEKSLIQHCERSELRLHFELAKVH